MARADSPGVLRLRKSCSAMGSAFSVVLYGCEPDRMEAAVDAAFIELRRLDRLFSTYRPESEWSLVNRLAAEQPVALSAESYRLLAACLEYSRQTEGAFDVTTGPLRRAWGFFRGTGSMPTPDELAAARRHVGCQFLQLNPEKQTIQFDHPGVEIDPGGIGKGYAVDRMVEVLQARGFDTALVTGSASSLYGLGSPPGEPRGWRAEVRDPEHPGRPVADTFLKDLSLSTSGTAEKRFSSGARMYSHIIDPRTGWPLQSSSQVSVIAPSALDGEVWAKAYLLNGHAWMAAHKPEGIGVLCCRSTARHPPSPAP